MTAATEEFEMLFKRLTTHFDNKIDDLMRKFDDLSKEVADLSKEVTDFRGDTNERIVRAELSKRYGDEFVKKFCHQRVKWADSISNTAKEGQRLIPS